MFVFCIILLVFSWNRLKTDGIKWYKKMLLMVPYQLVLLNFFSCPEASLSVLHDILVISLFKFAPFCSYSSLRLKITNLVF